LALRSSPALPGENYDQFNIEPVMLDAARI